jgi:O-antigen/teichoic acid export membrane protein
MTVSNVGTAVACLRYDIALPSAPESDVRGLLAVSAAIATALGLATTAAALLITGSRLGGVEAGGLLQSPLLLGSCVALVGIYQATGAWLLRRGAYVGVAALRLSQGGSFGALALLPGSGLLAAHVASFGAGLIGLWRLLRRPASGEAPAGRVLWSYRQFPLYNLPGAVLDVVGYSACTWVVASHYGRGAAGEYSQVQRIIGAPLMLMSVSLGQILLRHTAELAHDVPQLRALLVKLLRITAGAAAAAVLLLWLGGAPAVAWILGPRWDVGREVVTFLGIAVCVRACVSPLSAALLTLRRFGLILSWQAAYFCSAASLMPWVAGRASFRGYVRFYAAHELVFYCAYLYLIFLAVRTDPCAESSAS